MATCAVCSETILQGQQFVLEGSEVFHRPCVGQAYRSKLKIAEQSVHTLERQLADTRRAAARTETDANTQRNLANVRMAQVAQLQGDIRAIEGALRAAEDVARAAAAEVTALRAELASLRAPASAEEQDADATVQRFKMLELD